MCSWFITTCLDSQELIGVVSLITLLTLNLSRVVDITWVLHTGKNTTPLTSLTHLLGTSMVHQPLEITLITDLLQELIVNHGYVAI